MLTSSWSSSEVPSEDRSYDDQDDQDNEEAPPLQLSGASCVLDSLSKLHIGRLGVALDLLRSLFCLDDGCFLVHDNFVQLLEKEGELANGLFDLHNVIVTRANGAEDAGRLSGTVRFELFSIR